MILDPDKRILVVDDEVEVCNFVKLFFEERGFTVYQAQDGDEAVKVAEKTQPQVILLDVKMKREYEGFEALPRIREVASKSKVIMVTAVEDEASVLRGKALGASDYITKPLVLEYLQETVLSKIQDATQEEKNSKH